MAGPALLRGDIFWFRLDPTEGHEQAKDRPCVIISNDRINRSGGVVVVVPLTTKGVADLKHRILIEEKDKIQEPGTRGCPDDSIALVYQLRAIDPSQRLLDQQRVARVTAAALGAIEAALIHILDIF
jgi:mRNA interferase MazF